MLCGFHTSVKFTSQSFAVFDGAVTSVALRLSPLDMCLCCGSLQVHRQHPLFAGGMCAPCKVSRELRGGLGGLRGSRGDSGPSAPLQEQVPGLPLPV